MSQHTRPKVSVIMPVYNGERHLAEALDSLLLQSFTDFEVVAVDDGSTDSSWAILTEYAERDRRVQPHRLSRNRGHHEASNTGIEHSRGEYIARHDQDDVALPGRLAATVDLLDRRPEVGMVHSAYLRWLPDGTIEPRVPPSTHTALRVALLFGNVVCHASVTIRATVLESLDECYRELGGPQDYDLWIRLSDRTTIAGIVEPLVVYRQSTMAMTKQFEGEIDMVAAQLSDQQLLALQPSVDAAAIRRLYRFDWADRPPAGAVTSLHRVFEAAATSLPNLDPAEVRHLEARWTKRALRTYFSRRASPTRSPSVLWHIVRTDPKAALAWSSVEGTRRLRAIGPQQAKMHDNGSAAIESGPAATGERAGIPDAVATGERIDTPSSDRRYESMKVPVGVDVQAWFGGRVDNDPGMDPDVSVVVPTWNRSALLRSTLVNLGGQSLPPSRYEVVVVDDGSTDDTSLVVERFAQSVRGLRVVLVRQPNGGVNRARNSGVSAASGAAICFLDDDELAPPGYLEAAWTALRAQPWAAGVGGPALDHENAVVRTCSRCTIGEVTLTPDREGSTPILLGGNMMIRRETFDAVGLFDPELSGRGDETEWFHRADRRFFYDPALFIWHRRDAQTRAQLLRGQLRQGQSIPLAQHKQGNDRWNPRPDRIPRLLLHSLTKHCDKGYLLAAREVGATWAWTRLAVRERRMSRGTVGR